MTAQAALIWCPFPDEASARVAVAALLDERLIACGNCLPGVRSLFTWQGARDESTECGALLKTTAAKLDEAMERLAALHPYDTPATMGWTVRTTPAALSWLEQGTNSV